MKSKTFEEHLQEVFAEGYPGTDDEMPDKFDMWVEGLEAQEFLDFAESYGRNQFLAGKQSQ